MSLPLKRLTGASRFHLTDEEAVPLVEKELASSPSSPPLSQLKNHPPLDSFLLRGFDKISGNVYGSHSEGIDGSDLDGPPSVMGFLVFDDVVAAATFLVGTVIPFDEQIRLDGYRLCSGTGRAGSNDPAKESRHSAALTHAIQKTLVQALTSGYQTEQAAHLKRLMQDGSKTFEITEIGYMADLLYYGLSGGDDLVEMAENEKVRRKLSSIRDKLSVARELTPSMAARLRRSLKGAYKMAQADTLSIAASAVAELEMIGRRPAYDYSGISMKASKVVERELKHNLFVAWREKMSITYGRQELEQRAKASQSQDLTVQALLGWLTRDRRKKMELGTMRYCILHAADPTRNDFPERELKDFIDSLTGGAWLLSTEFIGMLDNISTRFRNGGVHEHMVNFELCLEALETIVIGKDPLLKKLLEGTRLRSSR